jgi:hypothetical protein
LNNEGKTSTLKLSLFALPNAAAVRTSQLDARSADMASV